MTHFLDSNLPLTSTQKLRIGLACPDLARQNRNFCVAVNGRFESSRCVTLCRGEHQVSDWVGLTDLGYYPNLPTCSATCANFPSAQAERGWNNTDQSHPNPVVKLTLPSVWCMQFRSDIQTYVKLVSGMYSKFVNMYLIEEGAWMLL